MEWNWLETKKYLQKMASPFRAENGLHSPSALPGSKGFEMGMLMGIRCGKGSLGLKMACGTGSGTASCGTVMLKHRPCRLQTVQTE